MNPESVEIRLLGRFTVTRGGVELAPSEFGGRLAQTLVRLLVTRRGRFTSKEALTEALWPDRQPADPAANLEVLVSRARRALGSPSLILTGPGGYSFSADPQCVVDVESFVDRVAAGRKAMGRRAAFEALEELQAAFDLWAGEPLAEDAYADWAEPYRSELERLHQEAFELAARAALASHQPALAIVFSRQAAAGAPMREASQLLLVEALDRSGDQAGALETFDEFRRLYRDDLGLDLSPEAAALQGRILKGEAHGPAPALQSSLQLEFAGRDGELSILLAAAPPYCGIVEISGRSGSGKTRLLTEATARLSCPVLATRAFLAEREEAWATARTLLRSIFARHPEANRALPDRTVAAIADVLPELAAVGTAPADPESRRALAMEGGISLLRAATSEGAVVVVDDLQWADATSLAFLRRAIDRLPGLGTFLAYRPEELVSSDAARSFLTDLRHPAGDRVKIELEPLVKTALADLFSGNDLISAVDEETDRTPLAISEVVRALVARGAIERDDRGRWRARASGAASEARVAARAGQERAILVRVDRQPAQRQLLLELLALLGREVSPGLLCVAAGRLQAEVLEDLGALSQAGLTRIGDRGWAAAHDLIAESVAARLGREQAARLHARLAEAVSIEGSDPSERARHLAAAGEAQLAAEAYAQAARQSLDRFASEEAERLADAGLALGPHPAVRVDLVEIRGEARARRENLAGAREDLREALNGRQGFDRSRLLARLAMISFGAEDVSKATELAELALEEAGDDPRARANALFVQAVIEMNSSAENRAGALFDQALGLYEELGDARGMADVRDGRAMASLLEGRLSEAAVAFDKAARMFVASGDLLRVGTPRANRGLALIYGDRAEEGLADVDEAIELERALGHAGGEAFCLAVRCQGLTALGRPAEAIESGLASLELARRLEHAEWITHGLVALGAALARDGREGPAEEALRESIEVGGDYPNFQSRGAAELAVLLTRQGRLDEAQSMVDLALGVGLKLALYEARLAEAELAAARGDPDAKAVAARALLLAEAGGQLLSARRLRVLRGAADETVDAEGLSG